MKNLKNWFICGFVMAVAGMASAEVIWGVTVEDYSSQSWTWDTSGRMAFDCVNGAGLSDGLHNNVRSDMWMTAANLGDVLPAHITLDLGKNHSLDGIHIWNYNEAYATSDFSNRGSKDVEIWVSPSTDNNQFVKLDNAGGDFVFPRAPGYSATPADAGFDVDLSGVVNTSALETVRLIRFVILANHGDAGGYAGFADVQISGVANGSSIASMRGVTVEDFSSESWTWDPATGRRAEDCVNGSGLLGGLHNNQRDQMWMTAANLGDVLPQHITLDLGDAGFLNGIHVWNYNEAYSDGRDYSTRGAKDVEIWVSSSADTNDLVKLDNTGGDFVFPRAPGYSAVPADAGFDVDLSGVTNVSALENVRLVRLVILTNHGATDGFTGLAEVQFSGTAKLSGVTVEDFSSESWTWDAAGRRAEDCINGSGLFDGLHNNQRDQMWMTAADQGDVLPAHITLDLGGAGLLDGIHVWNYNEAYAGGTDLSTRGAKDVEIWVSSSTNTGDFVKLDNAGGDFVFQRAPGYSAIPADAGFDVDLSGVTNASALENVRLIRFVILSNYGDASGFAGLAEVQFRGLNQTPRPYFFLSEERLTELRQMYASEYRLRYYVEEAIVAAEGYLTASPLSGVIVDNSLPQSRNSCLLRIYALGVAWRWTGDDRYAAAARDNLLNVCSWTNWNYMHFLDVAEIANGVAMGYNWFYDYLSVPDRIVIENGLISNAFEPGVGVYEDTLSTPHGWWRTGDNNWNTVCNGGLMLGALAIKDAHPEWFEEMFSRGLPSIAYSMASYGPDGAWPEGPGYSLFATQYAVSLISALDTVLGDNYGLADYPGFSNIATYIAHMTGAPSQSIFTFGDSCGARREPYFYWIGKKFNLPYIIANEHSKFTPENYYPDSGYPRGVGAVYYQPNPTLAAEDYLPLDSFFNGATETASFRSSWTDPDALYLAVKAGYSQAPHGHLDLGSFELDANGHRFVSDLNSDSYYLPLYFHYPWRASYYRCGSFSHNIITVDGEHQDFYATSTLYDFETTADGGSVKVELADAYPNAATEYTREYIMSDNRQSVTVNDQFTAAAGCEITWGITTRATVELLTPTIAKLTIDGDYIIVKLNAPSGATFTTFPSSTGLVWWDGVDYDPRDPDNTHELADYRGSLAGVNRLEFTVSASAGLNALSVSFEKDTGAFYNWMALEHPELSATGKTDNPDGDARDNWHEYVLGGDPAVFDTGFIPAFRRNAGGMEFTHVQRKDAEGLNYYLETTTNLTDGVWSDFQYTVLGTNTAFHTEFSEVSNQIQTDADQQFIRLIVE